MGKVDIKKVYNGGERLNRKSTIKKVMFMRKKKEIYGWDKSNKEKNKQFS